MEWGDLFSALALYLVLEGLLPFVSPPGWRRSLTLLARLTDSQLRLFGLTVMIAGLALLLLVRSVT
jgi:uncharacterized protein YjeT (DUF2065 family)